MELYRNGLKLTATIGLDESRGSVNVPVRLLHNEKDEYLNYTEQIHIRYLFDNQVKEEMLPTNDNGFYIPGKPLSHDGPIELAVHLINGDIELVTNELSFVVNNAPNGTTQVDPSEFTWQQLVDQYVNAKLDTFANKSDLSKFEENVNGSIENQNQNIESFKTDVNENLSNQDKKITDLQNTTKASLDSQNTKIDSFKSEVNTNLSNQNTSINQTTSAQNSKIATLESRMNTFTSLSEGSTTGDAELKDIRVGANGVTYPNAGDAVRGQYSQLKEDLVNLQTRKDLVSKTMNGYVLNTAGQVVENASKKLLIAHVTEGNIVKISCLSSGVVYSLFDKEPMYGVVSYNATRYNLTTGSVEVTIPTEVKYIVVCPANLESEDVTVFYKDGIQETVSDCENRTSLIESLIGNTPSFNYEFGAYTNNNGIAKRVETGSSSVYKCVKIGCSGYEKLTVKTYAEDAKPILVCDKNMTILNSFGTGSSSATVLSTVEVEIDNNAMYITIPCYRPDGYNIYIDGINLFGEITRNRIELDERINEIIAEPIPTEYKGDEICIFRKCLCIGDSFTAGGFNADSYDPDHDTGFQDYSYPTNLARMVGFDVTNMGHGGETTQSWNRTYTSMIQSGYDMCIILLGINDCVNYGSFNEQSIEALGQIISKVKEMNNHIKIFVSTIPLSPSYKTESIIESAQIIRDYVESIADDDVYLVDLARYGHLDDSLAYTYGHPTAYGYHIIAEDVKNYISWIISNNKMDFKFVQFIGTDLTHDTPR